MSKEKLLEVKHLKKYFATNAGQLHAVDDVSFDINAGETLGVVGESGCGKSTLGRAVLRLNDPTAGEVLFQGENILKYNNRQMKELKKHMQLIFQDPFSSLNPRMTVSQSIALPLIIQGIIKKNDKNALNKKVEEMMDLVGLASRFVNSYPHELDGGRWQRIGIARALVMLPQLVIADECISALDVSIQAQVVNLMRDLQDELGITYLFIAHDLSMVKYISNRLGIMHLGHIVETGTTDEIFANPVHPYTQSLLSAILEPNPRVAAAKVPVFYEPQELGIDYTKGTIHALSGTHQVLATDEEFTKWTNNLNEGGLS